MWRKLLVIVAIAALTLGCGSSSENKPAAIDWKSSDITADNVKAALAVKSKLDPSTIDSDFPNDIISVEITDQNGGKAIFIQTKPRLINETSLVKGTGGTAIIASSQLFENPNVNAVTLEAQAEMTDQYGKTTTGPVVRIKIAKDTASKVEWSGLANLHGTDPGNIYRIADNKYIHLGVLKNVRHDEVKL